MHYTLSFRFIKSNVNFMLMSVGMASFLPQYDRIRINMMTMYPTINVEHCSNEISIRIKRVNTLGTAMNIEIIVYINMTAIFSKALYVPNVMSTDAKRSLTHVVSFPLDKNDVIDPEINPVTMTGVTYPKL